MMIMLFFWVLGPCRLIGRCQLSEKYTVSSSPEDGDSIFLQTLASAEESARTKIEKNIN